MVVADPISTAMPFTIRHPVLRPAMLVLGTALIVASPAVGVLPGPGGIFVFAIGLSLVLRHSRWARRRYARLKRQRPRLGAWADWGMRRPSEKRRRRRAAAD